MFVREKMLFSLMPGQRRKLTKKKSIGAAFIGKASKTLPTVTQNLQQI